MQIFFVTLSFRACKSSYNNCDDLLYILTLSIQIQNLPLDYVVFVVTKTCNVYPRQYKMQIVEWVYAD